MPALDLSRSLYGEVVAPLLRHHRHSAALLGTGSEILGYDTERSSDHDWGPRLQLFVQPDAVESARAALAGRLPDRFQGWPLRIGSDRGRPVTRVDVQPLAPWLVGQLGVDPRAGLEPLDWLAIPQQQLLGIVRGAVYADPDHELAAVRDLLAWYPPDVWLWLLAGQWKRIFQEIAFVGRAAEVGDELGSKIIAGRLAREVMRLSFLQHKVYWPYTKWFGSGFADLPGVDELAAAVDQAVSAADYPGREAGLLRAYKIIAAAHNDLGITDPVDWSIGRYFTRPYDVLHGDFAEACLDQVTDHRLRRLPLVGSVDQFVDSTDVLSTAHRSRLLRGYWDRLAEA